RLELLTLTANGSIVSLTTATDRITTAQRRAVTTRDRTCTARGCHRPPAFCDVHHLRARADDGPTDTANLVLLCRRHHSQWHRAELDLPDLRVPWLRVPAPAGASP
ncbi:MAG: putative endonuclease, partial [Frankiales bacterium]|nr:putative endonuclease [Frankiales bacterium]